MPHVGFKEFRRAAVQAVEDAHLQQALAGATGNFRAGRERALADLPDAEALRDHLKSVRAATVARLADYLEMFERNARAAGAVVHWAENGEEATRIVLDIARRHDARLVVKSKSMTGEEIHLNHALEAAGITAVETDLGEWIIQLAGESPAHIIAPAIHKTRQQVADLFSPLAGKELPAEDIPALTAEARRLLRDKFLAADVGISGANLAVAETGSIVLVTNEGNGRMVTTLPPVHVAIVGIEKVVPTWQHAATWLQLLARSATGQPLSVYTSIITGPARPDDPDGPKEVHIVLLDNGRSTWLGTPYEEVLQCIRCGACLNVCPVYRKVGGLTYGSPYSGPIGAVVSPLLFGLEQYPALPHASTLCGACLDVCPSRIDLPRMLLALRVDIARAGLLPRSDHLMEKAAASVMARPRLYRRLLGVLRVLQAPLVRNGRLILRVAGKRWLPALAKRPFVRS